MFSHSLDVGFLGLKIGELSAPCDLVAHHTAGN